MSSSSEDDEFDRLLTSAEMSDLDDQTVPAETDESLRRDSSSTSKTTTHDEGTVVLMSQLDLPANPST